MLKTCIQCRGQCKPIIYIEKLAIHGRLVGHARLPLCEAILKLQSIAQSRKVAAFPGALEVFEVASVSPDTSTIVSGWLQHCTASTAQPNT